MFEVTKTQVNNAFKPEIVESTNIILKQAKPFVQMSYRFDGDLSSLSDGEAIQKVLDEFYKEHYQHKIENQKLTELELDMAKAKQRESEREAEDKRNFSELKQRVEEVAQATSRLVNIDELTEEQKENYLALYPEYQVGVNYSAGDTLRYQGTVYEVIQPHTSQADWAPNNVPALYKELRNDTVTDDEGNETEVIQEFVQPQGAHDAYQTGDKVIYNGEVYESLINANAYSPDNDPAGWQLVAQEDEDVDAPEEEEESESPEEDIPDFVQPTGAHDAYAQADKVRFEGQTYQSNMDNNVYSPTDYPQGWEKI